MPSGGSDSECSLFMCVTKMALFSAHGLLLWRQSKIQVFQDDVREKKEKKGRILETYIDANIQFSCYRRPPNALRL